MSSPFDISLKAYVHNPSPSILIRNLYFDQIPTDTNWKGMNDHMDEMP